MRNDETLAINALCEYLSKKYSCISSEIIEEPFGDSKPPDYFIKFGKQTISVEVTQTGHGFLLLDNTSLSGNPIEDGVDKIRHESSAGNLLEKAFAADVKKSGNWITNGESIVITYTSPIPTEKRSRLASRLLKTVKYLYQTNQILNYKDIGSELKPELTVLTGQSEIKGVSLEIFKTDYYKDKGAHPILENFFTSFYSPEPVYDASLAAQVSYIMSGILSKKSKKCDALPGPKWLVLINTHPILEYQDYAQFPLKAPDSTKGFGFERIFLIDNRQCLELFSSLTTAGLELG